MIVHRLFCFSWIRKARPRCREDKSQHAVFYLHQHISITLLGLRYQPHCIVYDLYLFRRQHAIMVHEVFPNSQSPVTRQEALRGVIFCKGIVIT